MAREETADSIQLFFPEIYESDTGYHFLEETFALVSKLFSSKRKCRREKIIGEFLFLNTRFLVYVGMKETEKQRKI